MLAQHGSAPRLSHRDAASAELVVGLYRELGGMQEPATLRPGAWDLCAGGTVIELDEELQFNRYRAATLDGEWAGALPWNDDYRELCGVREAECLRAATWGKRWANPSSDRMFGGRRRLASSTGISGRRGGSSARCTTRSRTSSR